MIRTTINLPAQLHHQLHFVAKGQNQTVSTLVRRILERELAHQKDTQMKVAYQSLENVKGIGKTTATDVSTNMDDMLYGLEGAWKGQDE